MGDTLVLPSGTTVSIDRPDFSLCKTHEDFLELKYALSEKIIDIELQIDLFLSGVGVQQGRCYEADWQPRAAAALKWAKLYRDECQNRQGLLSSIEKQRSHAAWERNLIEVIKAVISPEQFQTLMVIADAVARTRVCVQPDAKGDA